MNFIEFLRIAKIEDLGLPAHINQKQQDENLTKFQQVYACIRSYRTFDCNTISLL